MASIRPRSGKWQVRVRRHGHPPVEKTFQMRADAERWARAVELDMDRGHFAGRLQAERTLLAEAVERYTKEVLPLKRGAAVEGIRLSRFADTAIGQLSLAHLTPQRVAEYRDRRLAEVASGTVLRELQILSAVLNHAIKEWGVGLPANPVALIRRPKPGPARHRRLHPDEERRLMEALGGGGRSEDGTYRKGTRNSWVKPVVELALETAMRRGELLALQWKHVDLERRVAYLPMTKNGLARSVPLSTRAAGVLSSLPRHSSGVVFPISPAAFQQAFVRACTTAKVVDLHFHDLRHEATSRLFELGLNTMEVASVTGHETLQMLRRYTHLNPEVLATKLKVASEAGSQEALATSV